MNENFENAGTMAEAAQEFHLRPPSLIKFILIFALILSAGTVRAYPPAPHHTLFGLVRTEFGEPLNIAPSDVVLETPSGALLRTSVVINSTEPGVNYRLEVPMDSGTSGETNSYQPTALRPYFQFRMKVLIGNSVYLPIEMTGDFSRIGQPSEKTRIDLTLGVDSDGDGLPDAWEQALIDVFGGTLASIRPEDDTDGDGISNLDEYLAGTYAFDPSDGFMLSLVGLNAGNSQLEFLTIPGRNYTIQATSDLKQWTPVDFRVVGDGSPGELQNSYLATDVQRLRVEVPFQAGAETNRYFRAVAQ